MALPAGFTQFGNKEVRIASIIALETFTRGSSFIVRVWLEGGVSFTESFGGQNQGPALDVADRDALLLGRETAL